MPQYKVIKPGFYGDTYYHPEGKRKVLHVDKPFTKKNPMPSWVSVMPKESAGLKKKREALEKAQADLDAEKVEQDDADINAASNEGDGVDADASFMGKESNVETL